MRRQANQYPSSIQPHPSQPLTLCLFPLFPLPKHSVTATVFAEWYRCRWAPSLSSTPSASAVYIQVIFALNRSSGNWCDLDGNVYVFQTWRGRRTLFESLGFHVTNRQEADWMMWFFFFWPVITKIRMGLNASSLGEWKWSPPGERKTGPLARLRGLSLMLLAWHRELTLTGSFIQTHTKSTGTARLRDNYI